LEEGTVSTTVGVANCLFCDTKAAAVYWAIINPDSTPESVAKKGGSPRVPLNNRKMRRSAMDAHSLMAKAA